VISGAKKKNRSWQLMVFLAFCTAEHSRKLRDGEELRHRKPARKWGLRETRLPRPINRICPEKRLRNDAFRNGKRARRVDQCFREGGFSLVDVMLLSQICVDQVRGISGGAKMNEW